MHISEGILPLPDALLWTALAAPAVAIGVRSLRHQGTLAPEQRAMAAMSGALLFALTLFPVPVPVAGVSSHLCATPVLALLLGVRAVIVPTAIVLLLQALFFAHGGLTTLGANLLTLGVVGPLVAVAIARAGRAAGLSAAPAAGIACGLAHLAVYATDTGIVALALRDAAPVSHWAVVIALGFAPVQVPLAIVEGGLSLALLRTLAQRSPSLVPAWIRPATRARLAGAALVAVLVLGAGGAPVAAAPYDGADETVLAAAATAAGRRVGSPLAWFGDGEVGRCVLSMGMFAAGWAAGFGWARARGGQVGDAAGRD